MDMIPSLPYATQVTPGNDATTFRSVSGHYILINGNVIDYVCKTQGYITLQFAQRRGVLRLGV